MRYPNLELIEYIFDQTMTELYPEIVEKNVFRSHQIEVFPQTWANTATGFDSPGTVSGQAFTDEYTTVVRGKYTDKKMSNYKEIYGVFFGNRFAYAIDDPPKVFFKDLEERHMSGMWEAAKRYKHEEKNYD